MRFFLDLMSNPQTLRNIRIDLSYDGSNYCGWQKQKGHPSVQETVEQAIQNITREQVKLIGSGRTDAGVHAVCQTANFFTSSTIPIDGLKKGINSLLPWDIALLSVSEAPKWFHSRKSAKSKTYRYRIVTSPTRLPLIHRKAWCLSYPLDMEEMEKAAQLLLGEHDFSSLMASGTSIKSTIRTITNIKIVKTSCPEYLPLQIDEFRISVSANGFLKYMVRNIAGLLKEIGAKRIPWHHTQRILEARDRTKAPPTAPAWGLYLLEVSYPGY